MYIEPLMDIEHFTELFVCMMASDVEDFEGKAYKCKWNDYKDEIAKVLTTDFNDDVDYRYLIDIRKYNSKEKTWDKEFSKELKDYLGKSKLKPGLGKDETYAIYSDEFIQSTLEKYIPESIELMKSFTDKVKYFDNKEKHYDSSNIRK